jgi:pilus assembly protein CpaE
VKALQLRKDDFDVLLQGNVDLMKEMMRVVAERQVAINQRVSEEASADSGRVKGLMTVIFSPRGGSGRSTIAANISIALAQQAPERVALVDLDLLFGQQTVMLNLNPRNSLATVTPSALKSLDRESFAYYLNTHEDSSLRVLIGAQRPEEGEMVTGEHVRIVTDLLRRQFVHVIVDTNTSFSDANLGVLETADVVLMVVTPELASLRDTRECQRIFFDLLGFDRSRFQYVLNHINPYRGVELAEIEQIIDAKISLEIPYGGETPSNAALQGTPLVSRWPNNTTSKTLLGLTRDIDAKAKEALALASR